MLQYDQNSTKKDPKRNAHKLQHTDSKHLLHKEV